MMKGFQTSAGPTTIQSFLCRLCSCNDLNVPIRVFCHQPTSGTCKLRAVHYTSGRIQIQAYHFYGRLSIANPIPHPIFVVHYYKTHWTPKGLPGKLWKHLDFELTDGGPSETERVPLISLDAVKGIECSRLKEPPSRLRHHLLLALFGREWPQWMSRKGNHATKDE